MGFASEESRGPKDALQWRNVNHVYHLAPPPEIFGAPTKILVSNREQLHRPAAGNKSCFKLINWTRGAINITGNLSPPARRHDIVRDGKGSIYCDK